MRELKRTPRDERLRALGALASRQYGVVPIWQLLQLGFTHEGVRRMAATGRLHRLYRGVYVVGHRAIAPRGRLLAAVYACGSGAVASHQDAAWLWEVRRGRGSAFQVTVAGRPKGPPGIRVHCVRSLDPDDVAVVEGIPVTSLARTLVDLGAMLGLEPLRRAFEEADRRRLLDAAAVGRACARGRGRSGVASARRALALYRPDAPKTRSELERDLFAFCRRIGAPEPSANVWVEGQEVDAAWIPQRVVAEIDGYEFHRTREAFERDRARSAQLLAAGWKPIRITDRAMKEFTTLRGQLLTLLGIDG